VRDFVRKHATYPHFKSLAYTLIIFKEGMNAQDAERRLLGKGPACEACLGDGSIGVLPCDACGGTGDGPVE